MKAREGDTIVVHARHVGDVTRSGEVREVIAGAGSEHYRVRWESGSETILYPRGDLTVLGEHDDLELLADRLSITREPDHTIIPDRAGESGRIDLWFDEHDDHTDSRVTIQLRGFEVTGFGQARRNPHDPEQPIVGEELAAARALCDLAHQLLDLATYQIEKREGHPLTLLL